MSGARIYRVGSPFNGPELTEVDFEQSANVMYLAHLNHAPTKLTRAGHTDWTFASVSFGPTLAAPGSVAAAATTPNTDAANSGNAYFPISSSYAVTAIDDVSGQESRASATSSATNDLTLKRNYTTITWAAVTGATRYRIYKADNTQSFGYIGNTTALTFQDNNIGPDYSDGPPVGENPFAAAGDYPSTVTFFEQRLLWGRTTNHPNAIWGSRSGMFENMDVSRPIKASDSLTFALVAGRVNAVNQLVSVNNLLALTSDSIFKVDGGQAGYISATDFVVRRQNGRGSSRLNPLVIDSVCFYQTSVGNGVRTLGYQFQTDSIDSNDITIYSPHLFRGFGIVSWAYAQEPRSLIWAVRSDGKLLCFTWEQEQQVWGWTICETDGLVESVCVISEGAEDRLYLTVRRNGKLLIERMAAARWSAIDDTCFLDSAVTYLFDTPTTILRNLNHLEGKTVSALVDGNVVSGLVVTGGTVTLSFAATKATCGLPYTATIETLPLAIQERSGWTVAKPQTQAKAVVRVIDSRGLRVGPNDASLEALRSRVGELPGQPNALQNGLFETWLRPEINGGARCVVQSVDPLPMTVTGIYLDPSVAG
ncbi:hypothetical protein QH494_15950 [Sphingomonas sp. AR_OL41]|uniref:hypothetical protein n=1 Tax=Sphingomonas sp. AR_OL41 TaxID=3042729 RepID=UPI0024809D90|nr:hypothetical protein [Sphingomonas sp. AR_OL41]MDH7973685.1 hypothetical protein [Sphingomonas sp. AR_OL41]